jgi:hypothetical protein
VKFESYWRVANRPVLRIVLAIMLSTASTVSPVDWNTEPAFATGLSPAFGQARVETPPAEWADLIVTETFDNMQFGDSRPIGTFTRGPTDDAVTIFDAYSSQMQWGGTDSSAFASIGSGNVANRLTLALASSTTYRYLGFYWTAGNGTNHICLHNGGIPVRDEDATGDNTGKMTAASCLAQYSTSDLTATGSTFQTLSNRSSYNGNPNLYASGTNCMDFSPSNHCGEPFAFIHIFFNTGFTHVTFSGGGFEIDTITASTRFSYQLTDLLEPGTLIGAESSPAYSLTTARVIPVDPRSESVPFPGILLSGQAFNRNEPNATLCLTQVTNQIGNTAVPSADSLRVSAPTVTGVTTEESAPLFTFTGSQTAVRDVSAQIRISTSTSSRIFSTGQSLWFRASVQSRVNAGFDSCQRSTNIVTAVVFELRPIRLNNVNQLGIPLD